jgi:hypothetical protein
MRIFYEQRQPYVNRPPMADDLQIILEAGPRWNNQRPFHPVSFLKRW